MLVAERRNTAIAQLSHKPPTKIIGIAKLRTCTAKSRNRTQSIDCESNSVGKMLPIVGVFVKFSVAGAGWCILSHWEKRHKKERKAEASPSELFAECAISAAAAPFAGAVLLLTMDAFFRGMILVLSRLEDEKF